MTRVGPGLPLSKYLLPLWVRVLSWPALVFLLLPIYWVALGLSEGLRSLPFFGLGYAGPPLHPAAIAAQVIFFLHGLAALALIRTRRAAVDLALVATFSGFLFGLLMFFFYLINRDTVAIFLVPILDLVAFVRLLETRPTWLG